MKSVGRVVERNKAYGHSVIDLEMILHPLIFQPLLTMLFLNILFYSLSDNSSKKHQSVKNIKDNNDWLILLINTSRQK